MVILEETFELQFNVVVYPIMPLTSNSGMIEIINDAETLYAINKKKNNLLQYILEKNESKIIGTVLDNYMLSLVSYTLHSYFIGLGDRHLQNIMITDDGYIFHIDFGFILGQDSYPLSDSPIRLNLGMLDVMGGPDSERYKKYLDLCSLGINVIRKYFNMFFILLNQNINFSEKQLEKFILCRFQPRQSDDVIVTELCDIIKQSQNAYSGTIRDFLHYHTQEKTVQTGFGKVIKNAYGLVKTISYGNN